MKAIFVGGGSLLLECAEVYASRVGEVCGVISDDPRVARWANERGIRHHGSIADADLDSVAFDDLISVNNLRILPAHLIAAPRRVALNFHDGPLPGRAGLNVPAWSILEGCREHGVTWHEMTSDVDAGRVVAKRTFAIDVTDTAYSLNARCFEEGLASFRELAERLRDDMLKFADQVGGNAWYAGTRRPDNLGVLAFGDTADDIARTVRGLSFGSHPNPLALPKVVVDGAVFAVGAAEPARGTGRPGEVLSIGDDTVTVAAADGAVTLSRFRSLTGEEPSAGNLGLAQGDRLDFTGIPEDVVDLVGQAEAHWRRVLTEAVDAVPPYAATVEETPGAYTHRLAQRPTSAELAAAWLAWAAGLKGADGATLAIHQPAEHPALSDLRPVALTLGETARDTIDAMDRAVRNAQRHGPMAADLPCRLGDAEAQARPALSVVLSSTESVRNAVVVLNPVQGTVTVSGQHFTSEVAKAMCAGFETYLQAFLADPDSPVSAIPLSDMPDARGATVSLTAADDVLTRFRASVASRPDATALECGDISMSYRDLDIRSDRLAGALAKKGVDDLSIVGICLERSADLVIAMLATMKAGAAYLPLDPSYPTERLTYMLEDSGASVVIGRVEGPATSILGDRHLIEPTAKGDPVDHRAADEKSLAYVIYTSGSTGNPKGVMVTHRNLTNFLEGMDRDVPIDADSRFLSATSVSFDISVLEIFWTLSRGATLVLHGRARADGERPDFSLFYFASESSGGGHEAYKLLLDGARFADENGFSAVWTPERHFHAFGGLYPNPAITAATLAGITKNIKLRAGSSVLPLHHPVRVAEDWALVDNLSNGRAGLAIASGWQPNDFLLRPDSFADRKTVMLDGVETMRALWRGETLTFPGHDGSPVDAQIHPRPVQSEMPLWLTAAGNPETFEAAGRLGCGVLTHLLGQTFEELGEKIRAYRAAWRRAGHDGDGHVVVMLHTFIAETEDAALAAARGPMKSYLGSAVDLVRRAAWTFPTIVERADAAGNTPQDIFDQKDLSDEELDQLLDHAFERYYRSAGLFGTPETAAETARRAAAIGADEIGCLVDFGIDADTVLANLPNIRKMMDKLETEAMEAPAASVSDDITSKRITHFQCTPSMARLMLAEPGALDAIGQLSTMLVGGEAVPTDLAKQLGDAGPDRLLAMYGPTETTIWSAISDLSGETVRLGAPIANTQLSVRSADGRVLPPHVEGELWIGGEGVTRGYLGRPDLTADRFVDTPEGRFYRTGDLVRRDEDGGFAFLGRMDGQVKVRGHRIEVGEIEARLCNLPNIREAAVRAIDLADGDTRLIAFVRAESADIDPDAIRSSLAERLPEVMVPSRIVEIAEMPLTPNGKIDRKALHLPQADGATDAAETPGDETEAAIAAIWAQALGLAAVPLERSFFDLGGHSLLVVQVQRQISERLSKPVTITDIFRFPTVRSLAEHLRADAPAPNAAVERGSARAAARRLRIGQR